MLFYRYISENITDYINKNEHEAGNISFNYQELDDSSITDDIKDELIDTKGYIITERISPVKPTSPAKAIVYGTGLSLNDEIRAAHTAKSAKEQNFIK